MTRKNIDPIFKQILEDTLTQKGVRVETEVEVARLPRTIDGIVTVTDPAAFPKLAQETPFNWFEQFNIIAFKGANDPLTEQDYHLIWGRAFLAIGEKKIPAQAATLTIICGSTPRNEIVRLQTDSTLIERNVGIYQVGRNQPRCYLVVINELPPNDERYAILYLFTSSKKRFQEYLQTIFADQRYELASVAALIQPIWTQEIAMITVDMIPEENYKQFEAWIVRDLLPRIPVEKKVSGLSLKERLTGLSLKEQLSGVASANLSTAEIEQLRYLLDKLTTSTTSQHEV